MIWSFCIAADVSTLNPPEGMVRAADEAGAFALIDHPDTNLYLLPADVEFPAKQGDIVWARR